MGARGVTVAALIETAHALVGVGKGLLAIDESNATCDLRLVAAGIEPGEGARRAWRDVIVGTPGLARYVSGAILYDETLRQTTSGGVPFPKALMEAGLIIGAKVDTGARALAGHPGELITGGLDGLRGRLKTYVDLGVRFAKWRAVFTIGGGRPGLAAIHANAHALARYAALCQEAGLAPIVEPEVLMAGGQTSERCGEVTEAVLASVFHELRDQGVALEGLILKPNMVLAGDAQEARPGPEAAAEATLACFSRIVPAAVAGIAFLSGGQSGPVAATRLNAINVLAKAPDARAPWPLVFSFGRAIEYPALGVWHGEAANIAAARAALSHRARCSWAAANGAYGPDIEDDGPR